LDLAGGKEIQNLFLEGQQEASSLIERPLALGKERLVVWRLNQNVGQEVPLRANPAGIELAEVCSVDEVPLRCVEVPRQGLMRIAAQLV